MRCLVLFIVVVVSTSSCPSYAKDLTVATFNTAFLTKKKVHVKFGESFDLKDSQAKKWNKPSFRNKKFSEAVAHVAKAIAAIDADVISLTEIGDATDLAELKDAVKKEGIDYPYAAVCECTDDKTYQHVAVLSKFKLFDKLSQIPGRESYYEEADDPNSEASTGISKGMKVKFSAHGYDFHLYVLHLISERGGHNSDQKRVAQASIARRHFLPLLASAENVVVTGDLNDRRGEPTLQRIRGFHDIYPDLIQTGRVAYFRKSDWGTRWTYEFKGERQQIDHILLSENIKTVTSRIKSRVVDPKDALASDHRAFVVRLRLKQKKQIDNRRSNSD